MSGRKGGYSSLQYTGNFATVSIHSIDSGQNAHEYTTSLAYASVLGPINRFIADGMQAAMRWKDGLLPAARLPVPPEYLSALKPLLLAAKQANADIPKWIPQPVRGTLIHSRFAHYVRELGRHSQYSAEVSYKATVVEPYGTWGSVRADAVFGPTSSPIFIVDLKTGFAYITEAQLAKYEANLPPGTPVIEIRGE